jgi:tRNA (adenine57-N1/adenine58-N1)-methyltransferase
MSLIRYKDLIEYGDTVILYLGYENMLQFIVEKGKTHQTKFGALKHDELIGVKFGSKISCSKGYAYILHPTPELWTVNLPHRTQIIYSTDISVIALQLELRPGSRVIEAGVYTTVFFYPS